MLCPLLNSHARSRSRSFADAGEGLPPAVGDGQSPVAAERLEADLRAWRGLPALELGGVHQTEDLRHDLGIVTELEQLRHAEVAVDVVGYDRVELLVGRQRVAVLLTGRQLGRRRLVDGVLRDGVGLAPPPRLLVAPPRQLPDEGL